MPANSDAIAPLLLGDSYNRSRSWQSHAIGFREKTYACVRESCRVDLCPEPLKKELAQGYISQTAQKKVAWGKPLGFDCAYTDVDVWDSCAVMGLDDKASKIILVLKLALALLAYGHNTVDAEILLRDVCKKWELPKATLELGLRSVHASFRGMPIHLLFRRQGIVFDKLVASTRLATLIATTPVDVDVAAALLETIVERPLPYGWFVQAVCFECFCMCATIGAFSGTYTDALAVALIAPWISLIAKLCEQSRLLERLEGALIPIVVGLITPLVWRFVLPIHYCRVTVWILSNVLFFLPGVQLIYGAYEMEFGSLVNGSSRLVTALVRCMFIVIGLTIGWQVFGYNAAVRYVGAAGAIASLPPSVSCRGDLPWLLISGVYNIPLLFFLCVLLNLRLRDMLGPLSFGYLSLLAHGALSHAKESGHVDLPPLVVNFIGVFISGNLGCLSEYLTGTPAVLAVLPVVLVYAPGAVAVRSMLAALHNTVGDMDTLGLEQANVWGDLVLQGVSYAFGMYVAVVIWRPVVRRSNKARGRGQHWCSIQLEDADSGRERAFTFTHSTS